MSKLYFATSLFDKSKSSDILVFHLYMKIFAYISRGLQLRAVVLYVHYSWALVLPKTKTHLTVSYVICVGFCSLNKANTYMISDLTTLCNILSVGCVITHTKITSHEHNSPLLCLSRN